jgi:hypothetical protein
MAGLMPFLAYGQDSKQTDAKKFKIGIDNLGVTLLDYRTTFFGEKEAVIWGTSLGYVFGQKRSKVALGYYTAVYNKTGSLISLEKETPSFNLIIPFARHHDLYFVNLMYLKGWIWHKHWILATPIEIGFGSAREYPAYVKPPDESLRKAFVPIQVGVNFDYRYSRWFGAGIRAGYRSTLFKAQESVDFNGFYYTFGLSIYGDVAYDLLKLIKKKKN